MTFNISLPMYFNALNVNSALFSVLRLFANVEIFNIRKNSYLIKEISKKGIAIYFERFQEIQ